MQSMCSHMTLVEITYREGRDGCQVQVLGNNLVHESVDVCDLTFKVTASEMISLSKEVLRNVGRDQSQF